MTARGPKPASVGKVFAAELAETRTSAGLSQEQLASRLRAMGVTLDQSKVSKIESGARGVSLEEAFALAAALDVAPSALMAPRDNSDVAIAPQLVVPGDSVVRWLGGLILFGGSARNDSGGKWRWPPNDLDPPLGDIEKRRRWWLSQRSDRELRALDHEAFRSFFGALGRLFDLAGDPHLVDAKRAQMIDAYTDLAEQLEAVRESVDRMHTQISKVLKRGKK